MVLINGVEMTKEKSEGYIKACVEKLGVKQIITHGSCGLEYVCDNDFRVHVFGSSEVVSELQSMLITLTHQHSNTK